MAAQYADLIAAARQNGDYAAAGAYLSRLEALASRSQLSMETEAISAERRRLAVDWAAAVLRQQGPAAARSVLAEAVGAESAAALALPFARVQSLQAAVSTQPGMRRMELAITPRPEGEALVQRLYDALAATGVATVTLTSTQPPVLHIDIPFADGEELGRRQGTLASAIDPSDPEWAGLAALLRPQELSWDRIDDRWRLRDVYQETVSLADAREVYESQAQALEAAAAGVDPAHPLAAVLPDLLRAEADIWRALGDNQGARFMLTLYPQPGAALERTWAIAGASGGAIGGDPDAGAVSMSGQAAQYRLERFAWAAAGVWLAALALAAVAWWGFRRDA